MERRIDSYIKIAEELANQEGGIELLKKAIANIQRLRDKGELVNQRNLEILKELYKLAIRVHKETKQE